MRKAKKPFLGRPRAEMASLQPFCKLDREGDPLPNLARCLRAVAVALLAPHTELLQELLEITRQ